MSRLSDLLEAVLSWFQTRHPNGMFWGVMATSLIHGLSDRFLAEPLSLFICIPIGMILANGKALVSHLKGEPELDERIVQALNTIKKYREAGGSESDVRRLYYELSVKLIKDAGIEIEELAPQQEMVPREGERAASALPPAGSKPLA